MPMSPRHDPRLIQANIALFKGERLEAQRLLDEYYQAHKDRRHEPLILWLDAQTRATREERLEGLRLLVHSASSENPYARLARLALADEAEYERRLSPPRRTFARLPLEAWSFIGMLLLAVLLTGGLVLLLGRGEEADAAGIPLTQTALVQALPTRTPQPDRSVAVIPEEFTLRYDGGLLQVAAIEDGSQRVIDDGQNVPLLPVPGARFYALRLLFECRQAICNEPPQAALTLRLDDLSVIPRRDGVRLEGTTAMQPVALGRATSAWVVFEIPVSGVVAYLEVRPHTAPRTDPPAVILLDRGP
ncbi:MAG: hypothetical protein MUE40_13105 [Anaerolineae bacterium]|nr:hypothetical protein [Anaerolineae bacterium]